MKYKSTDKDTELEVCQCIVIACQEQKIGLFKNIFIYIVYTVGSAVTMNACKKYGKRVNVGAHGRMV